jgi:hypothetical protein
LAEHKYADEKKKVWQGKDSFDALEHTALSKRTALKAF